VPWNGGAEVQGKTKIWGLGPGGRRGITCPGHFVLPELGLALPEGSGPKILCKGISFGTGPLPTDQVFQIPLFGETDRIGRNTREKRLSWWGLIEKGKRDSMGQLGERAKYKPSNRALLHDQPMGQCQPGGEWVPVIGEQKKTCSRGGRMGKTNRRVGGGHAGTLLEGKGKALCRTPSSGRPGAFLRAGHVMDRRGRSPIRDRHGGKIN